ncbi:hypothetical protein BGZ65_003130 [Modicella reniformis]|uniref:C2H2-type domain-containing protein n=1 Tax=Modicella reniformis TaxID=1440133 RepID=A0A9P6IZU8_9FUNG|nr:hypothetical protein BGZ65_003130 [Modicella reniformis]
MYIRDHTTPQTISSDSNSDPLAPPQDMLSTLEKLLMDISPFPPTIPNLAKPTCPPLDERIMAELSSPSSSFSSISSYELIDVWGERLPGVSDYKIQENRPKQYQYQQYQVRQQYSPSSSVRSVSPVTSPCSHASSSPSMTTKSGQQLPYWSPSTPSLQLEHDWSARSSPVMPSLSHRPCSSQPSPWGLSLFEQINLPLNTTIDLDSQSNDQSQQQRQQQPISQPTSRQNTAPCEAMKTSSNIVRRAARTPLQHRTSSDLFGLHAYKSTAHFYHHAAASPSTSSSTNASSSTSTNTNTNTCGSSKSSSSGSNLGANASTRETIKLYPCPTCSKPFPTRTQLKSHIAIHNDNFPFPCLYAGCDLHFKRKHDLRRHVDAKHALVKKYLCSGGCGEGFGRRDQMIRHLRRGTCGRRVM